MTSLLDDVDQTDVVRIDENRDYLAELTGPGGKYDRAKYQSDTEMWQAIAKGKVLADVTVEHRNKKIDELRADYTKLRDEYNTGPKLQELLDQLTKRQQLLSNDETLDVNEAENQKPGIDLAEIENLVSNKIQETERRKREEANLSIVKSKLKERYGNNANNVLIEQVEKLGLTVEDAEALAKKSPEAFMRTLGLDQQPQGETFQSPPTSNQRSDTFLPSSQKRTWSYYQKMKKENPDLYYSPKISNQMVQDAAALGDAFKDGDYHIWN